MITANEAKTLSESINTDVFKNIISLLEQKIRTATNEGKYIATFYLSDNKTLGQAEKIIKYLKDLGYQAKREKGYDQRENSGWDYIQISW